MMCPTCSGKTVVIETRENDQGIRRRRWCSNDHKFTTLEVVMDGKFFQRGKPMANVQVTVTEGKKDD